MERKVYCCIVTCANDKEKIEQSEVIMPNIPEVARYLLAFKPKKGFEIRHVMIHQEHYIL